MSKLELHFITLLVFAYDTFSKYKNNSNISNNLSKYKDNSLNSNNVSKHKINSLKINKIRS